MSKKKLKQKLKVLNKRHKTQQAATNEFLSRNNRLSIENKNLKSELKMKSVEVERLEGELRSLCEIKARLRLWEQY